MQFHRGIGDYFTHYSDGGNVDGFEFREFRGRDTYFRPLCAGASPAWAVHADRRQAGSGTRRGEKPQRAKEQRQASRRVRAGLLLAQAQAGFVRHAQFEAHELGERHVLEGSFLLQRGVQAARDVDGHAAGELLDLPLETPGLF